MGPSIAWGVILSFCWRSIEIGDFSFWLVEGQQGEKVGKAGANNWSELAVSFLLKHVY